MRLAIIDLGTNSVRFDVWEIFGKHHRLLRREKVMVRLGQRVFISGRLDPIAVRRTLQAFESFAKTCELLQTSRIVAFATAVLREGVNSVEFLDQIREASGIALKVISGAEEARLISRGILENETLGPGKVSLIDIGGGSTEISICAGKRVLHAVSLPLGTARLQQVFLKSSPPAPRRKGRTDPVERLREHVRITVRDAAKAGAWPKTKTLVGSSGTVRSLARVLRKTRGEKVIHRRHLTQLIDQMRSMNIEDLGMIPGLEPKRVDMILAGAILLESAMLELKVKTVRPTVFALRDGILSEELKLLKKQKQNPVSAHLEDFKKIALRLGAAPNHLDQVVELSGNLFDHLQRIHRLGPEWKAYLYAAAMLHDTGDLISHSEHEKHSYYLVKNLDLPSIEGWEREFIAQLCLHHSGGTVQAKHIQFGRVPIRKRAFLALLSLLRVADALDRGHRSSVRLTRTQVGRTWIRLGLATHQPIDLELLRLDQKKELFEKVFGRRLETRIRNL